MTLTPENSQMFEKKSLIPTSPRRKIMYLLFFIQYLLEACDWNTKDPFGHDFFQNKLGIYLANSCLAINFAHILAKSQIPKSPQLLILGQNPKIWELYTCFFKIKLRNMFWKRMSKHIFIFKLNFTPIKIFQNKFGNLWSNAN